MAIGDDVLGKKIRLVFVKESGCGRYDRAMRYLLAIALLTACVTPTYGNATSATMVSRGRWVIEVDGRGLSPAEQLEWTHRKAAEICPGGYAVEQASGGGQVPIPIRNASTGQTVTVLRTGDAATVIKCDERAVESDDPFGERR